MLCDNLNSSMISMSYRWVFAVYIGQAIDRLAMHPERSYFSHSKIGFWGLFSEGMRPITGPTPGLPSPHPRPPAMKGASILDLCITFQTVCEQNFIKNSYKILCNICTRILDIILKI